MTNNTDIGLGGATPTGYSQYDEYVAEASFQGKRVHYTLALPLVQVPVVLPVPDPAEPLEDNREIRPGHAKGFADYVRRNPDWHSGPLTVRTTSAVVKFKAFEGGDFGTLKVGILQVPRNARSSFKIIDGQHRVLGIDVMLKAINDEISEQRNLLTKAVRNGEDPAVKHQFERKIKLLEEQRDRTTNDSIAVDLVIEDSSDKARQIFVDVANNAVGISKSVTGRFDSRKVVNRALSIILTDPTAPTLIVSRVDQEKDRVTGSNPNLLGAVHLAEIIRTVEVGIAGRVSDAQEKTLDEQQLAANACRFLHLISDNFSMLNDIAHGKAEPADVRDKSLLLSTTMLRVLAGVYHNLKKTMSDDQIGAFFKKLDTHMGAPIAKGTASGDLWLGATTSEAFADGAGAPGARAQQVKELTEVITGWATDAPAEL